MLIALLGPLEVRDSSGTPVALAGLRLRRLLARLAVDPGRLVTAESLIDAIWADRPPAGAASALQSLVSRLRHSLPDDAAPLESQPAGYRLAVPQDTVDIARFERLAAAGRSAAGHGDPVAASGWFAQALSLWRGAPFADLGPADFAVTAAARLTELRLRTVENRAEVILAVGQPDDVIAELAELATEYPLREQLWALHMRALCAAARPAEALACFAELRRTLGRELGTDPSPALRDLHTAILRGGAGPLAPPAWADRPAGAEARTEGWGAARTEGRGAGAEARTADAEARRGNLRFALTSFVGRDDELQRVGSLLDQARLVTLVGPGGAGKTRLAVEIAARRAGGMAARRAGEGTGEIAVGADDGAWVVELAALRDPAEVPATVIAALGLRGGSLPLAGSRSDPAPSTTGALVEALRDRQALIVLDNCEHLVDACARVADAVLGGCRGMRILATSREPLAITGEVVCPVGPLPVPPVSAGIEQAREFPAIRLFADRAAAACPGFTVSAENLPAVGEICRRLDGLPLAIELACARLRTLPAEEISARLGNRFRLLAAGNRTPDARHRTLHAAVEWSWELFTAPERALARRLTVFADGATPQAAEAVCADRLLPAADVLGVLSALADKSFVQLISVNGAPPRYRMLETIREYAAAALEAAGEASRMRRAHAAYFLAQAAAMRPRPGFARRWPCRARLRRVRSNPARNNQARAASEPCRPRRSRPLTGTDTSPPPPPARSGAVAMTAATISAAAPASTGLTRRTSSVWPPTLAFSSAGVPAAITRPWSMTAICPASRSASFRFWVVSSTVIPSLTRSLTRSQTPLRPAGSSPVVGSSRNSTRGRPIRLAVRSSRRRMPPE
jgi:predicted ATPase/DNA-binding SARP family transcriptional activator